ncbi:MAG: hypothetical protein M1816_000564 [Peltula sp. TS41687]|nr:MAG: hypothetical protein M1816_000564 [Peltula sp. TS41687]
MGASLLSANLADRLLGDAVQWYTEEISSATRLGLQISSIEEGCNILETRFRESSSKSLLALWKPNDITIQDARQPRDPTKFMQRIVLLGRMSNLIKDDAAACMILQLW